MSEKPHHHGDLKNALVRAGLDLLEEGGLDGLTLRRAAARAGVSHAAPAHHFDGKDGLLRAIAARGFVIFAEMMEFERERAGTKPRDRLIGICRGYLKFAETKPALFKLIFTTKGRSDEDEELAAAGARAYGVLAEACAPFQVAKDGPGVNEAMIWALVHGYATLRELDRMQLPNCDLIDFESILPPMKLKR